ncbi:kinase-like domain-containing protein [Xylaria cf. heliscus]|nr:kinase-like domain-containing protein [Xylaria cf. heliscus]
MDHIRYCRAFTAWANKEENYDIGVDGSDKKQKYVSAEKLMDYADEERVARLLGPDDKDIAIQTLRNHYLIIYFILVYITDGENRWTDYFLNFYTQEYKDHGLPLPRPPDEGTAASSDGRRFPFPHTPDGLKAWRQFYEHQWRFIPLCLSDSAEYRVGKHHVRTQLDIRHIIPVTVDTSFYSQGGSSARLLKVIPHKASGLHSTPIIMKEYSKDESEQFTQERRAYTTISNIITNSGDSVSKYFLRYYGSFIQADRSVIILEYADQGTLLDLYKDGSFLPRHEKEARVLWDSLGMLFYGLETIHARGQNNLAIHQDIKPANVFVFSDPKDPSGLVFKLGDFGLSSTSEPSSVGDAIGQDNHGSKMYSGPWTTQWSSEFQSSKRLLTRVADIWSLGCLLFEAAVWMASSEVGREKFRHARVKEVEGFNRLADAGYRGTFHDGFEVLSTVREEVNKITRNETPAARLSHNVMKFVLEDILEPRTALRLSALELRERFCRALDNHQSRPPEPEGPSSTATSPNIDEPSLRTTLPVNHGIISTPHETQRSILLHRNSRADGVITEQIPAAGERDGTHLRPARPPQLTISDVIKWIQDGEPCSEILDEMKAELYFVKNRDQVFVIDNSASMYMNWPSVQRTAQALSYLLGAFGPPEFKFCMTNSPVNIVTRNWRSLFNDDGVFYKHRPSDNHGKCQMEVILSNVLSSVVDKATMCRSSWLPRKPQKVEGVDIYILTDGVWEPNPIPGCHDEAGGVDNAIATVIKSIRGLRLPRTFLSIQFIRFGRNPDGIRRLRWLDDGIKHRMGGWDIVDTTFHEGSVRKMLIGPKNTNVDNGED